MGTMVARGPTGALYWRDPETPRATVRDGRSRAGDFVTLAAAGYVWFMAREDELPREVSFVPQLPRAPGPVGPGSGKLLRRVLREQAARG